MFERYVKTSLQQFRATIRHYFLGTIILTHRQDDKLEVADGQQGLATPSILIAAIRDYLYQNGGHEKQAAENILQQLGESDNLRFFAVLPILPIISAQGAVRATIVQAYRTDNPFS